MQQSKTEPEDHVTLYKLNNRNQVQEWVSIVDFHPIDGLPYRVLVVWGLGSGQQISTSFPTLEEAREYFKTEVNYKIRRQGYSRTVPTKKPFMPMLAQEYNPKCDWQSFFIQPKYDGVRCMANKHILLSRKNTRYDCIPHIEMLMDKLPDDVTLDGEIYWHGVPFEIVNGHSRRHQPTEVTLKFSYMIYDLVDEELPYLDRFNLINKIVDDLKVEWDKMWEMKKDLVPFKHNQYLGKNFPLRIASTLRYEKPVQDSLPEIKEYFDSCRKGGYEGCMLRNPVGGYELNTRTHSLLKLKAFSNDEFLILDITPDKKGRGVLECSCNGSTFTVQMNWLGWQQENLFKYKENYIGGMVKIEFEGYTNGGQPRNPRGISITKKGE